MKRSRKIFFASSLVLAAFLLPVILVFIVFKQPAVSKALVERTLSTATGYQAAIAQVSFTIRPLRLTLSGVDLRSGGKDGAFLSIPQLDLLAELEGPWGDKTLLIDDLEIKSPFLRLAGQGLPSAGGSTVKAPSLFARVAGELAGLLLFRRIDLQSARVAGGEVEMDLAKGSLSLVDVKAAVRPDRSLEVTFTAHSRLDRKNLKVDVNFSATGAFDKGSFRLPTWRLAAPGFFQAEGFLDSEGPGKEEFQIVVEEGEISPGPVLAVLREAGSLSSLDLIDLGGPPLPLYGTIEGLMGEERRRWSCEMGVRFPGNRLSVLNKGAALSLPFSGTISISGIYPDLTSSLSLEAHEASFEAGGIRMEGIDAGLSASGTYPSYSVEELFFETQEGPGVMGVPIIRSIHLRRGEKGASGKIKLDDEAGVRLQGVSILSPLLGELRADFRADGKKMELDLEGSGPSLVDWPHRLGIIPAEWELTGRGKVEVHSSLSGGALLTVGTTFSFSEVELQEPTITYSALGIQIHGQVNNTVSLKSGRVSGEATLAVDKGEILLDRFYFDMMKQPVEVSAKGAFETASGSGKLEAVQAGIKDLIQFQIEGTAETAKGIPKAHLSITVPDSDASNIYRHFIRTPFGSERPFLAQLDLSGALSADLDLLIEKGREEVSGAFRWQRGSLKSERGELFLEGIELDLPVSFQTSESGKTLKPVEGGISVGAVRLPLLPMQSLNLPLVAKENMLVVPAPLTLKAPGGSITVGPLTCRDWVGGKPLILTSASFQSIDLAQALSRLLGRSVPSQLNGKLDPIRMEGSEIETEGGLELEIFGGIVSLEGIRLSDITSAGPHLRLDARLTDLKLAELTRDTSFGKIEGILGGKVEGLEIAYGQPQQFDLILETVKKKGTPQRVSLKAVENISRLGGGGSPFMGLAGTFASLFKEFPYEKMGVHARLENDVFRVNGTIKEKGVEYLVKRSAFSGVNVINQNPDNRISFKDMVNRLKRVTSDAGGAVIE